MSVPTESFYLNQLTFHAGACTGLCGCRTTLHQNLTGSLSVPTLLYKARRYANNATILSETVALTNRGLFGFLCRLLGSSVAQQERLAMKKEESKAKVLEMKATANNLNAEATLLNAEARKLEMEVQQKQLDYVYKALQKRKELLDMNVISEADLDFAVPLPNIADASRQANSSSYY